MDIADVDAAIAAYDLFAATNLFRADYRADLESARAALAVIEALRLSIDSVAASGGGPSIRVVGLAVVR